MLIDSNVIIYAAKPNQALRRFIARHAPAVSVIVYEILSSCFKMVRYQLDG